MTESQAKKAILATGLSLLGSTILFFILIFSGNVAFIFATFVMLVASLATIFLQSFAIRRVRGFGWRAVSVVFLLIACGALLLGVVWGIGPLVLNAMLFH